jgi:hypothetical protein
MSLASWRESIESKEGEALKALCDGREHESGDFFPLKVVSTAKDCDTRAYTQYIDQDEKVNAKESYL